MDEYFQESFGGGKRKRIDFDKLLFILTQGDLTKTEHVLYDIPISTCFLFLKYHNEKEMEWYENLCQTWTLIAAVHGVELKIPFLEEKKRRMRKKSRQEKSLPLHLQFMKAGVVVNEK